MDAEKEKKTWKKLRDEIVEVAGKQPILASDNLQAETGYLCTVLDTSTNILYGVMPMVFTTALVCGIHQFGYQRRYCYENRQEAILAIFQWSKAKFQGDPPGPWIKEKPSDRLGPGATADMKVGR